MITQLERSCTSLLANESINTNQVSQRNGRGHYFVAAATVVVLLCISMQFANAGFRQESQVASANTRLELIDWHVSGLWVINSPVAWVKVTNYNNVPIHEITMEYQTFDTNGKPLDRVFTLSKVPFSLTRPAILSNNILVWSTSIRSDCSYDCCP